MKDKMDHVAVIPNTASSIRWPKKGIRMMNRFEDAAVRVLSKGIRSCEGFRI